MSVILWCVAVFFLCLSSPFAQAQEERSAFNTVYAEWFGNGGFYSINYERLIGSMPIAVRFGFTYVPQTIAGETRTYLGNALMLNYFIGNESDKLELGIGFALIWKNAPTITIDYGFIKVIAGGSYEGLGYTGTATIGYRHQPVSGGLNYKVAFTPWFNPDSFSAIGGISIGWGF